MFYKTLSQFYTGTEWRKFRKVLIADKEIDADENGRIFQILEIPQPTE